MWQGADTRAPFRVFCDVTMALLYREFKTRFGNRRFGAIWLLLEPLMLIVGMSIMFTVRGREGLGVSELPVFIATGLVPIFLFRKSVSNGMKAVEANKGLFTFPLVRPFSAIVSRVLLEGMIAVCLLVVLVLGFQWLDYSALPHDIAMVIILLLLLVMASLGVALALCCAYERMNSVSSVWSVLSMPLTILSGAIFPILSVVPYQYHDLLLLNPLLHFLELIRIYWIEGYPVLVDINSSWAFILSFTVWSLFIGLVAYRADWRRMIAS